MLRFFAVVLLVLSFSAGVAVAGMDESAEMQFVTEYGQLLRDANAGRVSKDTARQARRINADVQRMIVELDNRLADLEKKSGTTQELINVSVQKERVMFNALYELRSLRAGKQAKPVASSQVKPPRHNDGVMDMRLTGSEAERREVRIEISPENIASGEFE